MQEYLAANSLLLSVFAFALLALGVLLSPVIYFIYEWRRVRQAQLDASLMHAEMEAALTQDMLNRGMSVEQIQQVLQAASGRTSPGPVAESLAELIKQAKAAKAAANGGMTEEQVQKWKDFAKCWGAFGKQQADRWERWYRGKRSCGMG